jgi:hypothetical protein
MDKPAKPWAHLPNAAHIDRVLANFKENPDEWVAARGAAWSAAWGAAWDAAWDAIAALIAWDDCAYLLDLPPEALHIIIRMDSGVGKHQAVLLLPASIVFNGEKR